MAGPFTGPAIDIHGVSRRRAVCARLVQLLVRWRR